MASGNAQQDSLLVLDGQMTLFSGCIGVLFYWLVASQILSPMVRFLRVMDDVKVA